MKNSIRNLNWEQLKDQWEKKGYQCELHSNEPQESWSSEGHKTEEIFVLLEGELEVSYQGKTYRPNPGEQIEVPANEPHTFTNPGKIANRFYWIYNYEWQDSVSGTRTS